MPPNNQQPIQTTSPGTDQLLEHHLVNADNNAKTHQTLAEHQLVKTDEIGKETIMMAEHQLVKTGEIVDAVKELSGALKPQEISDGMSFNIKGTTGDKGDLGATGAYGITGAQGVQGEKGDAGEQGLQGEHGLDGSNGLDGTNGVDGTDGKDGTKGVKGDKGDAGKDSVQNPEDIAGLINPHIDFNKIQNIPTFKGKGWAGTGYLREISDVAVSGVSNGQSIQWNSKTNKWENYTPSSVDLSAYSTKTVADALYKPIGYTPDLSAYLTSATAASTYVPYSGATTNVNLNTKSLTNVAGITAASGTFGATGAITLGGGLSGGFFNADTNTGLVSIGGPYGVNLYASGGLTVGSSWLDVDASSGTFTLAGNLFSVSGHGQGTTFNNGAVGIGSGATGGAMAVNTSTGITSFGSNASVAAGTGYFTGYGFINSLHNTSTVFLKGDGSVDSTLYLSTTSAATTYV